MKKSEGNIEVDEKANAILDVIMSYARLEFDEQLPISDKRDVFDAISSGVNMLGEELKENVISLKEKERLLKEIHHRVKNNMQIISSMLRLQFSKENDERVLDLIKDSQSRIYAMALVHEMLYSAANLKDTNLKEYLHFLTKNIFQSYSTSNHNIKLKIEVPDDIFFETEKMIPLGLIMNEILTNSLKYAFENEEGKIEIKCEEQQKDNLLITITDNGKGLVDKFNLEEDMNLGMQLVFLLGEQIDAKVEMVRQNGLGYQIQLKK